MWQIKTSLIRKEEPVLTTVSQEISFLLPPHSNSSIFLLIYMYITLYFFTQILLTWQYWHNPNIQEFLNWNANQNLLFRCPPFIMFPFCQRSPLLSLSCMYLFNYNILISTDWLLQRHIITLLNSIMVSNISSMTLLTNGQ